MARAKSSTKKFDFWHSRQGYAVEALITLLLTYALASRAIDTGSLIQYFVTIVLFIITVNRVIKIFQK